MCDARFVLQASARLLRLLSLLQARTTWSGVELANRLEITPRTLRRDVDRLRSLGYPVDSTTGTAGGYMLGDGASLPPLSLDEDEATAVFVGLHAAGGTGVTGANTASLRALAKLERVVPTRLRKNLRALHGSVLEFADRGPSLSLADVSLLARACTERAVVDLAYRARGGEATRRTIEPLRLVRVGPLWYLVAWDPTKGDWRTFRLDRVEKLTMLAARFKARAPPRDDLVRYVTESLASAPSAHRARVLLHAPFEDVRPRLGPREGSLERAGRDRCVLSTGGPSLDWVLVVVVRLGVEFEVLEPDALAIHLTKVAERLTRGAKSLPTAAPKP